MPLAKESTILVAKDGTILVKKERLIPMELDTFVMKSK